MTGVHTGYAQVLAVPVGWVHDYHAHVRTLAGKSIRAYPNFFEDYYWSGPLPTLVEQELQETGQIFTKLVNTSSNEITVAARRLNLCLLREAEEDSILDATIALEALVGGDERQEITHKLALRIAALSRLSNMIDEPASDVFRAIKQIYAYRSAVVHGSTKASKKQEITIPNKAPIRAVVLATNYLRMIMKVLIEHPQYLKPDKIDEKLLLGGPDTETQV